jgi:hypothetical protein
VVGAPTSHRLAAIDAMRGLAAVAVMLYHVPVSLREEAGLPPVVSAAFGIGDFGVDAFFVVSGFVIALSVADADWTVRFLGRFVARRSVRLDPSYWAAIALELTLGWIGVHFLADAYSFPTVSGVVAHLFYVQDLMGIRPLSGVFWTLCYEVQFYLLLVGALVLAAALKERLALPRATTLAVMLLGLAAYSLCIRAGVLRSPMVGLMVDRFYQFGLGTIGWVWASGRVGARVALPLMCGIVGARVAASTVLEALVIGGTVAACCLAVRSARFNQLATVPPLPLLGRMSYSLYLFHGSIMGRGSTVVLMLVAGSLTTPKLAAVGLLALLMASLAFSYLMHVLIEVPAIRLARKVTL